VSNRTCQRRRICEEMAVLPMRRWRLRSGRSARCEVDVPAMDSLCLLSTWGVKTRLDVGHDTERLHSAEVAVVAPASLGMG
jgi:hypothetical protein